MIRKNIFIREDQEAFLESLDGNSSEHIRFAIDAYRDKIRRAEERLKTAVSKSKHIL